MNSMRKYGRGFSIVELMVSMVIGFLILAGMLSVYLSNSASFRFNSQMARIQENGRLAMSLLENDIRMSAYGGCAKMALDEADYEPVIDSSVSLTGEQLLQGVDWNGSDTLTIYGIPVQQGADAYINSDCDGDPKIEATADPNAELQVPITSRVTYVFHGALDPDPGSRSQLMVARDVAAVDEESLVGNVDAFNICLGIDSDMDEEIDRWVTTLPAAIDERRRVTAVQVDLILASDQKDDVLSDAVTPSITLCDGSIWNNGGVADKRLHKLFHSTVTLRNKVANGYGTCEGATTDSSRCDDKD